MQESERLAYLILGRTQNVQITKRVSSDVKIWKPPRLQISKDLPRKVSYAQFLELDSAVF